MIRRTWQLRAAPDCGKCFPDGSGGCVCHLHPMPTLRICCRVASLCCINALRHPLLIGVLVLSATLRCRLPGSSAVVAICNGSDLLQLRSCYRY